MVNFQFKSKVLLLFQMIVSSTSKATSVSKSIITNEQVLRLQQSEINEFETRTNFNTVLQQLKMKTLQNKTKLDNMTK